MLAALSLALLLIAAEGRYGKYLQRHSSSSSVRISSRKTELLQNPDCSLRDRPSNTDARRYATKYTQSAMHSTQLRSDSQHIAIASIVHASSCFLIVTLAAACVMFCSTMLSKALMLRGGAEAPSKLQLFVQIFLPSYGHNSAEGNFQNTANDCKFALAKDFNAPAVQANGL
jgi:hypothetical protein